MNDALVTGDALASRFTELPRLLEADRDLIRRGAFFDCRFKAEIGPVPFDIRLDGGRIVVFERGPFVMRGWSFAISGSLQAWEHYWRPVPAPGWHDLFALRKRGEMTIEGELQPVMAHLQYLKDLLALPRQIQTEL
jgi:hypothetical protein